MFFSNGDIRNHSICIKINITSIFFLFYCGIAVSELLIIFFSQGEVEFKSLLYIPGMAPFSSDKASSELKNIKLYVRRVFISDDFHGALVRHLKSSSNSILLKIIL